MQALILNQVRIALSPSHSSSGSIRADTVARQCFPAFPPDLRRRVFFNAGSLEVPAPSLVLVFRIESFLDGPGARNGFPEAEIEDLRQD